MSHVLGDSARLPAKVYRDHMVEIPREMRVARRGFLVTDQQDGGMYDIACPGDESGWMFLTKRTTERQRVTITPGV